MVQERHSRIKLMLWCPSFSLAISALVHPRQKVPLLLFPSQPTPVLLPKQKLCADCFAALLLCCFAVLYPVLLPVYLNLLHFSNSSHSSLCARFCS
jgi:hypothetical protein